MIDRFDSLIQNRCCFLSQVATLFFLVLTMGIVLFVLIGALLVGVGLLVWAIVYYGHIGYLNSILFAHNNKSYLGWVTNLMNIGTEISVATMIIVACGIMLKSGDV